MCHARQIDDRGVVWYVWRVIVWRTIRSLIMERGLCGRTDHVEIECYAAQHPHLTREELLEYLRSL